MGDVRKLPAPTLAAVAPEPNPDVVDVLNQMLAAALSGEIVGIGYVCAYRDGTSTAADYVPGVAQISQLVSGSALLHHMIARDALDTKGV